MPEEAVESQETEDELIPVLEDPEDEKGEAEKETEDGEEDGEKEKKEESELDPVEVLQEEVQTLRQIVRASKRENIITQAKLERLGKKKIKDEDNEDDEDDTNAKEKKEESLSTIEKFQKNISDIGASKGAALDVLLEAMEQNKKYEDIRKVCSRANFDDIFEVIAIEATKNGGNLDEALLEVELNVWNKANPYKYMYELIKKHHPNYATKDGAAEPGDKGKGKTPSKVKAPGTIADKGGDSTAKGGWTAKRIDDLSEDELHIVPREIYELYMRDELD